MYHMGYHMYHLTYFTYPRCCTETLFNSLRNSIVLRWYVRKNADMFISISGFCPAPPSWVRGASSSRCPQDCSSTYKTTSNSNSLLYQHSQDNQTRDTSRRSVALPLELWFAARSLKFHTWTSIPNHQRYSVFSGTKMLGTVLCL